MKNQTDKIYPDFKVYSFIDAFWRCTRYREIETEIYRELCDNIDPHTMNPLLYPKHLLEEFELDLMHYDPKTQLSKFSI